MPRYHFDLESDVQHFRDEQGSELPDDEAAREEAVMLLGAIVRTMMASRVQHEVTSSVRNQIGTVIFGVRLSLVTA